MRRLFISYAREVQPQVRDLAGSLRKLKHEVWFDEEIPGGARWWAHILEEIRGADGFIYVVSPGSARSQACRRELEYALALGLPVLPVQVKAGDLAQHPQAVQDLQVIDYITPGSSEALSLAGALNALPPRPPLPDPLPVPPPAPVRPLDELRTLALQDGTMSYEQQSAWVMRAREALRGGEDRAAVNQLVAVFRTRRDLLHTMAAELATFDEPLAKPGPAAPPAPTPEPAAMPPAAKARKKAPRAQPEPRAVAEPAAPPATATPRARPLRSRPMELAAATAPGALLLVLAALVGAGTPPWLPAALAQWLRGLPQGGVYALLGVSALVLALGALYFVEDQVVLGTGDAFMAAGKAALFSGVVIYTVGGPLAMHDTDWLILLGSGVLVHWLALWACIVADV